MKRISYKLCVVFVNVPARKSRNYSQSLWLALSLCGSGTLFNLPLAFSAAAALDKSIGSCLSYNRRKRRFHWRITVAYPSIELESSQQ